MEHHQACAPVKKESRHTTSFSQHLIVQFKGLAYFILLQAVIFSCKKPSSPAPDHYVRFASGAAQVSPVAGPQQTVAIESNSNWKITLPTGGVDWFELDKTTGQGNDNIKIKAIKDNNTGAKRTAVVSASLTNGQGTAAQLTIEQDAAPNSNLTILWKKVFGGSGNDYPFAVITTTDGGQVFAGRTTSNNEGDVGPTKGGIDFWVVKLNNQGQIAWNKTFGGTGDDVASSLAATPDGGYVVTGYTNSNSTGDVGANHGAVDYWVIKLNGSGALQWQKTLGGDKDDFPSAITVTSEGAVVVAGTTKSHNNGDVGANHGNEDYWIVKLDHTNGNIGWKKVLGGNSTERARAIAPTNDGGVIVGGEAGSNNNGDVGESKGSFDFWIVRLDKDGNIGWKKQLGGSNIEELSSIAVGPNATVVAVGTAKSNNNGDVGATKGSEDFWIVQLNATTGALNWQKTLGGSMSDHPKGVVVGANGNIVVGGYTYSNNSGDVGTSQGGADFWIVQLNNAGTVNWKKLMGGSGEEQAHCIAAGAENSYVIAGSTYSHNSGDVGENHGNSDCWIVKLKE
jgi:hypothetical protein